MTGSRRTFHLTTPAIYVLLLTYLLIVVYPLCWLVGTSLKPDQEIYLHPLQWPDRHALHWENFSHAWTNAHFETYFLNSVVLTVSTVAVTVFLAAMAGYALSRFRFFGVRAVFFYFLAGLMVPIQLAVVPLFF